MGADQVDKPEHPYEWCYQFLRGSRWSAIWLAGGTNVNRSWIPSNKICLVSMKAIISEIISALQVVIFEVRFIVVHLPHGPILLYQHICRAAKYTGFVIQALQSS